MSRPISRHTAAVAEPVKMFQHQTGKPHEGPFGEWRHSPCVSVRKEGSKLRPTGGLDGNLSCVYPGGTLTQVTTENPKPFPVLSCPQGPKGLAGGISVGNACWG